MSYPLRSMVSRQAVQQGFQKRNSVQKYFGDQRPRSHANDNLPKPANDNYQRPSFDYVTNPYSYSQMAFDMAMQSLLYLTPWGRALALLLTAYDLYKLLLDDNEFPHKINQYWVPNGYMKCPGEGGCAPPMYWTSGGTLCGATLPNVCGTRSGAVNKMPLTGSPTRYIVYGDFPGSSPGFFKPNAVWVKVSGSSHPRYETHYPSAPPWPGINTREVPHYVPPGYWPGLDAEEWPIYNPGFDYPPKPWQMVPEIRPNLDRPPQYQTWRGPLQLPRSRPFPPPVFPPVIFPQIPDVPVTPPLPRIDTKPDIRIDTRIDHRPRTDGRVDTDVTVRQRPGRKPPRSKTKERKLKISAIGASIRWWANAMTEGKDLIDALWRALPKNKRTKPDKGRRTVVLQKKVEDLYRNWLELDLPRALKNYIENELQDRFYGGVGKLGGKAVRQLSDQGYWDRPVGLQGGDRYRPRVDTGDKYDWFEKQLPKEGRYTPHEVLKSVGWI